MDYVLVFSCLTPASVSYFTLVVAVTVCHLIDTSFINLDLLYLNSLTVAQYQSHHLTHNHTTSTATMKSYITLALVSTALALPQHSSVSSECSPSASGTFQIQNVVKPTKRDLQERQLAGALTLTLKDGILKDQAGRQGYIAANDQ